MSSNPAAINGDSSNFQSPSKRNRHFEQSEKYPWTASAGAALVAPAAQF
jgi:hypothetical protein